MRLLLFCILVSLASISMAQVPSVGGKLSVPHQPTNCGDALVYYDGYFYHTIEITNSNGITQCWLGENLHTDNYSYTNPTGNDNTWGSQQNYGYLYYFGDVFIRPENYDPYHRVQGQCPDGYAIPSFYDWYLLSSLSGGSITNATTAWSELKLTEAISDGGSGKYWSSYIDNSFIDVRLFTFDADTVSVTNYEYAGNRASIRCIKDIRERPIVNTVQITNITSDGATINCNVVSDCGYSVSRRGIIYSYYDRNPQVFNSLYVGNGSGTGTYSVALTGLSPNSKYFVRANARNAGGDGLGDTFEFWTGSSTPYVTTKEVTDIEVTTASGGGNVISDGGATVTVRGICWNTTGNPTTSNSYTTDGSGTGDYNSSITGLSAGNLYYVRAYATNANGTGYGNEVTFVTSGVSVPSVALNSITSITTTAATIAGNVTYGGGSTVTTRGAVYNTSGNPNIDDDDYTTSGTGTGSFSTNLSGLTPSTTYHVKTYATNSTGTGYSSESIFATDGAAYTTIATLTTTSTSSSWRATLNKTGNALKWEVSGAVTASVIGNDPTFDFSTPGTKYITIKSSDGAGGVTNFLCSALSISVLDVTDLTSLTRLECRSNSISVLDVANLTNLDYLDCSNNSISILDVSDLISLIELSCSNNSISTLNVASLTNLDYLVCSNNSISTLNTTNLTKLRTVIIDGNIISTLDISNASNLIRITFNGCGFAKSEMDDMLTYLIEFNKAGQVWDSRNQTTGQTPTASLLTQLGSIWTTVLY